MEINRSTDLFSHKTSLYQSEAVNLGGTPIEATFRPIAFQNDMALEQRR